MIASFLAFGAIVTAAVAVPTLAPRAGCASLPGDAPYTTDCATLAASITCPNGIKNAAGGVVLLVHGTGSTGAESWTHGPYLDLLPSRGPTFDVCYVTLPNRSLGDMQVSAEYIAYNIPVLARQSATKQVAIIGHSQGAGCNPQWALDFWPSTRPYVSDYVALAGDFHGTGEGPFACLAGQIATAGCSPSVLQQSVGSKYLAAQNSKANKALVTTTSIYTIFVDVIQPEIPAPLATSQLPGAAVFALQDLTICGPTHASDHFFMLIDPAAFNLAYDALTHAGTASAARFNKTSCTYLVDNVLTTDYQAVPAFAKGIALDAVAVGAGPPKVRVEPQLMPYVCARGDAPASACA